MTAAAFELSVSLHDASCGCDQTRTYATFAKSMRRHHPMVWAWTADRYPVNDSRYIDLRNDQGGNPKRQPNPARIPKGQLRRLTSPERIEHWRQARRWQFADELVVDESEGSPLSLSQSALLVTIAEGWVRCSRRTEDGKAHETPPANVAWVGGQPVCLSGCPVAEKC